MGRHIFTSMEKINIFLITSALIIGALVGWTHLAQTGAPNHITGAIMPHHLLVDFEIEKTYALIAKQNPNIRTLIVLSPNHFGYGFNAIQTTNANISHLAVEEINTLATTLSIFIEPKYFTKEHGIMVHIPFIQKHFPDTTIIPIIIKQGTNQKKLDALITALRPQLDEKTLIIASIDFVHYTDEQTSMMEDKRTMEWITSHSLSDDAQTAFATLTQIAKSMPHVANPDAVAIDSPESLYVMTQLLQNTPTTKAVIQKRTSSNSLLHVDLADENTSHIFATFEK